MTRKNRERQPCIMDPGPELDRLREQGVTTFNLKIQRRTPNGKWVSLGSDFNGIIFTDEQVLRGEIEEYVSSRVGGQTYVVEFRDVDDLGNTYFKWELNLPGKARDPHDAQQQQQPMQMPTALSAMGFMPLPGGGMAQVMPQQQQPQTLHMHGVNVPIAAQQQGLPVPQRDSAGRLIGPPPNMAPAYITGGGYSVQQQWEMYYDHLRKEGKLREENQNMHWAMTFDQRSQEKDAQIARLQEQLAAKERETAKERTTSEAAHQREIATLRSELEKIRDEAREERHRAELHMIKAEFGGQQQKNGASNVDWVGFVAAMAPIATALVGFFGTRAQSATQMQLELAKLQAGASESQQKQLTAILAKPKDNDFLKTVVPLLTAVVPGAMGALKELLEGPYKAMEGRQDFSIMLMKMLSETMVAQSQAQGDIPWYQPLLEQLAEHAGPVAQHAIAMAAQQKAIAAGQPQPRQVPAQSQGAQQQAAGLHWVLTDGLLQKWAAESPRHKQAAEDVASVFQRLPPAYGFHTHEWRMILLNLHLGGIDPEELSELVVRHLLHAHDFGQMPGVLEGVMQTPEAKLNQIFMGLPIAQRDPNYVRKVLEVTCRLIHELNDDEEDGGDESDDTEEELGGPEVVDEGATVVVEGSEHGQIVDARQPQA